LPRAWHDCKVPSTGCTTASHCLLPTHQLGSRHSRNCLTQGSPLCILLGFWICTNTPENEHVGAACTPTQTTADRLVPARPQVWWGWAGGGGRGASCTSASLTSCMRQSKAQSTCFLSSTHLRRHSWSNPQQTIGARGFWLCRQQARQHRTYRMHVLSRCHGPCDARAGRCSPLCNWAACPGPLQHPSPHTTLSSPRLQSSSYILLLPMYKPAARSRAMHRREEGAASGHDRRRGSVCFTDCSIANLPAQAAQRDVSECAHQSLPWAPLETLHTLPEADSTKRTRCPGHRVLAPEPLHERPSR
jgi:hypothetical protein